MTKYFASAAVAALLAMPAFAQDAMAPMDKEMAMKATCKDMMGMDKAGMMSASQGVDMAMMSDDEMKAHTDMQASMSDDDKMKASEDKMMKMEAACKAHEDMTVMDAMKASM